MRTTIPYVSGSINPISGCVRYSRGCQNCYAHVWAQRFRKGDFSLKYFPDKLEIIRRKKSGLWFVGSMTDLFQDGVRYAAVDEIMFAIRDSSAKFLVLTKRAKNMAAFFGKDAPPANLGIGVTAEGQAEWDERVPILLGIKAAMRFVSVEPMLEAVRPTVRQLSGISWLMCGPETGARKRGYSRVWIDDLYRDCFACGVKFFDKRDNFKELGTAREWPEWWGI